MTASLSYGQSSLTNNDSTKVEVQTIRNSYEKLVERKALLLYTDSLEKEIYKLQAILSMVKEKQNETVIYYNKLLDINKEKEELYKAQIKTSKVKFILGGGGQIELGQNQIMINGSAGLMLKQKFIIAPTFGVTTRGNMLVGSNFYTIF